MNFLRKQKKTTRKKSPARIAKKSTKRTVTKKKRKAIPSSIRANGKKNPNQGHAPAPNHVDFYYLYVLGLNNGGKYVGITNNPERRFKEHFTGKGAKVTHNYQPQSVLGCYPLGRMTYNQAEFYEDDKTLELMGIYGLSCVRGGHWSMVNDKAIYRALKSQSQEIANTFHRDVNTMFR